MHRYKIAPVQPMDSWAAAGKMVAAMERIGPDMEPSRTEAN